MQAGFLAVMDAAERFEPKRENSSFLGILSVTLRNRFKEELGIRTKKRDILQFAESIETPALGDEDGVTESDTILDKGASLAFIGIEYRDFELYCRNIIGAALDTLPANQATIIRLYYLKGRSLGDIAGICGLSSKQAVCDVKEHALDRLARGKYRRELRECLDTLEDFHTIQDPGRHSAAQRQQRWQTLREKVQQHESNRNSGEPEMDARAFLWPERADPGNESAACGHHPGHSGASKRRHFSPVNDRMGAEPYCGDNAPRSVRIPGLLSGGENRPLGGP